MDARIAPPRGFQFTPLREGRPRAPARQAACTLFQFTPLREGRPTQHRQLLLPGHFNSRPSARGDQSRQQKRQRPADFNSRPSARGDMRAPKGTKKKQISIHAPPRGATTDERRKRPGRPDFNSRPSARGDARAPARQAARTLFQFTPLREGRPSPDTTTGRDNHISIHAPPRGATGGFYHRHRRHDFNSRPSARGDAAARNCPDSSAGFQFTPLREGRRATPAERRTTHDFNSRPSARGDGKRYAISANLLFNPYKSAWLNNSATQFVEIILVIFHRIIA